MKANERSAFNLIQIAYLFDVFRTQIIYDLYQSGLTKRNNYKDFIKIHWYRLYLMINIFTVIFSDIYLACQV
jgi:hypothetical protein